MENGLILDSLKVQGFRAFEDLQVEKLGRVNLITGKNNVGKTCLLEALQVYARRGEPNVLQSLLVRRDETYTSNSMKQDEAAKLLSDVKHVFYGRPEMDSGRCHLQIGSLRDHENRVSIDLDSFGAFQDDFGDDFKLPTSLSDELKATRISESKMQVMMVDRGSKITAVPFLPSYFRNRFLAGISDEAIPHTFVWSKGIDNQILSLWWDKIALTPMEDEVIEALQIIVPNLSRVNLVSASAREGNPERIPVVRIKEQAAPLPMKSLGEGINRMFGLALALVSSGGGLLMVDEVETGLHYSVQTDMWRLVFKTAKRLNIQVFATTHSSDCIRAFEEAAHEDEETEGVLIRLENKKGSVVAVPFDERKLEIATREGIEVR